jgi:ribosomal protein S15P/S13E
MKTITKNNKAESFWDKEEVISIVESSDKVATRVAICEKDGKQMVDIRKFMRTEDGYTQHTQKGISIPIEDILKVNEAILAVSKHINKNSRDVKSTKTEPKKVEVKKIAVPVKTKSRWTAEQKKARAVK